MTATPVYPLPQVPAAAAHRVAVLDGLPPDELLVHEIYRSVQGESTFAGLPCGFVRTTGCDLRCKWCDTAHAFSRGTRMTLAAVLDAVTALHCPLVEVTGGEPLLQPAVYPLMARLADSGHTVLLETSGAHDLSAVDRRVHVIMDLKCPDSGEDGRNHWPSLRLLKATDQIKFVLASRRDWDWTEATIRAHRLDERFTCLVSTVFGGPPAADVVAWLLAAELPRVRFQLQMHKYIWEPSARGV